jgi:TetR/AcrR family transcriptional regulator
VPIRDVILETTLQLIAKHGISATSVQDIADASSCSKANVLYHFSHKEQLIDEALASTLHATAKFIARFEDRGLVSVEDRRAFTEGLVELLIEHRRGIHTVITHPYLGDSIPGLGAARELMARMAGVVAGSATGELDRIRFGIAVAGVTYALVSTEILELDTLGPEELKTFLTEALQDMVLHAPSARVGVN